jgi:virulence-associated protein VagC
MPQSVHVQLINDGDTQIVCLPEPFELIGDTVKITRVGKGQLVEPEDFDVSAWLNDLRENADPDFMREGRPSQGETEVRDQFD